MNKVTTIFFIFSILGLMDTLYLSYHAITKTDVACWFFPKEWCKKVQYSKFGKTLGIPNAFLGLAMYVGILGFTYLSAAGRLPFWPAEALVIFGFIFSMYFTFIQAVVLRAFCTWCVLSAVNFTVMFLSLVIK